MVIQTNKKPRVGRIGRTKKKNDLSDLLKFNGSDPNLDSLILKLFNYKAITADHDHLIVARDGSYMDLINIRGHGLYSLTYEQQNIVLSDYHRFLQVFLPDHKYIITPFPVDTSPQKSFWGERYIKVSNQLRRETNAIRRKQLQTQLYYIRIKQNNNILVEQLLHSEEFYLLIFGKDKEEVRDKRSSSINSGGEALIMNQITLEKKKEILFRINNLNTEIK